MGEDYYQQMMHYVEDIERVRVYAMDITARKRADEALQRTTAELARSNKDLEQFASVASHDLQEPLRVVSGFVQLLQKKYGDQLDAEADRTSSSLWMAPRRMEILIKDLLAYARIGSGGRELTPTDTGAALRPSLGNLRASIEETAAEITYGELPTVRADAAQLVQLFQNLIGNALKFHGKRRRRSTSTPARNEDHWLFSVRDNGIGIDPKYLGSHFSDLPTRCTPASNTQARASAWRSARESWTATAGESGWNRNRDGSHLQLHAPDMMERRASP